MDVWLDQIAPTTLNKLDCKLRHLSTLYEVSVPISKSGLVQLLANPWTAIAYQAQKCALKSYPSSAPSESVSLSDLLLMTMSGASGRRGAMVYVVVRGHKRLQCRPWAAQLTDSCAKFLFDMAG